jgi:hypothetical protein
MASGNSHLPSIWMADFASKAEFDAQASALSSQLEVIAAIDDRMLQSRHPFNIKAQWDLFILPGLKRAPAIDVG